jgi:CHAT domain-containing protein
MGNQFESKALKQARNSARYHVKDKLSYTTFWAPLQNKIPDGSTVYLSSEGAFSQFNLEMLTDKSDKYILDKIELVQVTNTKELLRYGYNAEKQKGSEGSSEIVLGGNPDFYLNDSIHYEIRINDLPGAAKEVEDLSNLLISNNTKVTKVMGGELTEDWVKELKNPKVFHIATHGFYSDVKNSEDESSALLNSGLLLSGAGEILSTESHVNSQDGILTAYEAMNLKLDHTDLVVLSACETGLGEVKAGEGVYGLQRSFLIAGSKAIIISLYKVSDEVTQKLMLEFYANWSKSGDIRKSFIIAKQKIKNEYPDIPIYWGAFVLIEGRPQLKRDGGKKTAGM